MSESGPGNLAEALSLIADLRNQLKSNLNVRTPEKAKTEAPITAPASAGSGDASPFMGLYNKCKSAGDSVRKLKSAKAPKEELKAAVDSLMASKAEYKTAVGSDYNEKKPPGAENAASAPEKKHDTPKPKKTVQGGKKSLKSAKGTRDFAPRQMAVRERVFNAITEIFKLHGAETIDTPVFELRDLLMDKYGEDTKLIYNLEDQGGEILSLRYDLTVPFARFVGQNKIDQIKRYHIAKVYRRDQPAIERGRFREFYQCDFDIAGDYEKMCPDAEVLKIIAEILSSDKLDLGEFVIKVNDRNILDGMLEGCGTPKDQIRPACSAVDKLDKNTWECIKDEMMNEKFMDEKVVDLIGKYVYLNGKLDSDDVANSDAMKLVQKLRSDPLLQNKSMEVGLANIEQLLQYCHVFGLKSEIQFDLSLARGLDYYTGPIFEAVLIGGNVGSVSGGGRYDGLVNSLAGTKKQIPCVGMSIGIERLMAIIEKKLENKAVKTSDTQVLVCSPMKGTLGDRMKLLSEFWSGGVSSETQQKNNVKMLTQLQICEGKSIPFAAIIAKDELENGVVKLRHVKTRKEWNVKREDVVAELKKAMEKDGNGGFDVEESVKE